MPRLPLSPTAVWGVVKELRASAEDFRPVVVSGEPEHARAVAEGLGEGGVDGAVRNLAGRALEPYDVEGARVLVHVLAAPGAGEEDVRVLRLAVRKGAEVVAVVPDASPGVVPDVPHVLATDVVAVRAGEAFPLPEVAARVAVRAGDASHELAARLPALRPAVVESIVRRFSVQNGVLGVAIFIPGADFPVLTLNQIRMVLRIAAAHGEEIGRDRALEILSVVGAGLGFRAVARQLGGFVPGAGWAVKGGVAYTGTRALGEASSAYFAAGGTKGLVGSVRPRS
jgi:uncharacterized protein (DUF697 family)